LARGGGQTEGLAPLPDYDPLGRRTSRSFPSRPTAAEGRRDPCPIGPGSPGRDAAGAKIQLNYIPLISFSPLPSLKDNWLVGFTDAEGCFTVSFINNKTFRIRYIITQKGDINVPILSHLILLFNTGTIEAHSVKNTYSYIINGEKNCYSIYDYFNNNLLKSKKLESYIMWKEVHKSISNKEHLNPMLLSNLIERAKKINSIKRKSK
jgi:hypothetical protein